MLGTDVAQSVVAIDKVPCRVAVAHRGVGRKLTVDAGIEIEAETRLDDITEREPWRKLLEWIRHFFGIAASVYTYPYGHHQPVTDETAAQIPEGTILVQIQGSVVLNRVQAKWRRNAVVGIVEVTRKFIVQAINHLEAALAHVVLDTEFVLNLLRDVVQNFVGFCGLIVVLILDILVVEHVTARNNGQVAIFKKVLEVGADGVVPLRVDRQISQNILLLVGRIGFQVQGKVVNCSQTDHGQFIFLVKLGAGLELEVVVIGEEWQSQCFEKPSEVRAPSRGQESGFFANRSFHGQTEVAAADGGIKSQTVFAAGFLLDVHHRTQGIASAAGEGAGVKINLADEIDIDQACRATACALRRKVVDIRNLDAINIKAVFIGGTPADDDIVTKSHRAGDAGQGLNHSGNVTVATWASCDFVDPDRTERQRTLFRLVEGRGGNDNRIDRRTILFQGNLQLHRLRIGHFQFRNHLCGKTGVGHLDIVQTRRNALDFEATKGVGVGTKRLLLNLYRCEIQGFIVDRIVDPTLDNAILRHCQAKRHGQQHEKQ